MPVVFQILLALSHISIGYRAQRTPLRRGGKTWKMVAQTFFDVTFRWENKLRTPPFLICWMEVQTEASWENRTQANQPWTVLASCLFS